EFSGDAGYHDVAGDGLVHAVFEGAVLGGVEHLQVVGGEDGGDLAARRDVDVAGDAHRAARPHQLPPPGYGRLEQAERTAGQVIAVAGLPAAAGVLHAVGRVGGQDVDGAGAQQLGAVHRVGVDHGDAVGPAGLPRLLVAAEPDRQTPPQVGAVAADRRDLRGVLEPLVLQPGAQEVRVGVEVLGVHLDSDGVVAVHQRLVQGGAPAAHRVQDGQLRGEHGAGGAHGHEREVQQQLREV